MPDLSRAQGCNRCNGTGEYHGTRRDGSSYVSHCFACQGGGFRRRAYGFPATNTNPLGNGTAAATPARTAWNTRQQGNLDAFAAAFPAESQWLATNGSAFAQSLQNGVARYGNLTPRQLECVQRNVREAGAAPTPAAPTPGFDQASVDAAQAEVERLNGAAIAARPAPVMVAATEMRNALNTARTNGLRKPRLTLGLFEFRLGRADIRARANTIYVYTRDHIRSTNWTYRAAISESDQVFFARGISHLDDSQMELVRDALANPRNAAAAHGHDTTYCSCCRRLLTDPPSVMAGIGPVCITRFGWSF